MTERNYFPNPTIEKHKDHHSHYNSQFIQHQWLIGTDAESKRKLKLNRQLWLKGKHATSDQPSSISAWRKFMDALKAGDIR